jgi:hypothetical protein
MKTLKRFCHYFSFTGTGMWVDYGHGLPSYSVWFVPGCCVE